MTQPAADLPTARVVRKRGFNPAWLVPLAVLTVVAAVAWQGFQNRGVRISIRFENADGARVGDAIVYRGLQVGTVRELTLAPDRQQVSVIAELTRDAAQLATQGSLFWIVRPEVSLQRISGLDRPGQPCRGEPSAAPQGDPAPAELDPEGQRRIGSGRAPRRLEQGRTGIEVSRGQRQLVKEDGGVGRRQAQRRRGCQGSKGGALCRQGAQGLHRRPGIDRVGVSAGLALARVSLPLRRAWLSWNRPTSRAVGAPPRSPSLRTRPGGRSSKGEPPQRAASPRRDR